jgi:hypothetical protein
MTTIFTDYVDDRLLTQKDALTVIFDSGMMAIENIITMVLLKDLKFSKDEDHRDDERGCS